MKANQEQAIRQAVTDIFLSEGTYEDLERLVDGTRPHADVVPWQPLEHMSYEDILDAVDSAVRHVMKATELDEHEESPTNMIYKFPRRCDITGRGMWEGYCFGDGETYVADKWHAETHAKSLGYDTLEEAFEDGAYYYTTWEEVDEDEVWYESKYQDGRDAVEVGVDA